MRIPHYDPAKENSNFKRLLPYMPSNTFRMLICGPSGCGKTNTLMDMLYHLLYYDKMYFYYPTALRRVQITPKTSTNITRYLYSRGPVRQVSRC